MMGRLICVTFRAFEQSSSEHDDSNDAVKQPTLFEGRRFLEVAGWGARKFMSTTKSKTRSSKSYR